MEFKNPVKITNWSIESNLYRNLSRPQVDNLINKADRLQNDALFNKENSKSKKIDLRFKSDSIRKEAIQLWRTIINHANNLN